MLTILVAALLAAPARPEDRVVIDHETWRVVGWNDSCSVALTKLSYPRLGDALSTEPYATRAGLMTLKSNQESGELRWTLESDGAASWDERYFNNSVEELKAAGYVKAGYPETVLEAVGRQPLLAQTLLSTQTFASRLISGWPSKEWRMAGAHFNPLTTCVLLVFENRQTPRQYDFLLTHTYNPRVRIERAYAHASNARLLFNDGNLDAGTLEAATAAALAPELAIGRYGYAALLALTGRHDEAMRELTAAVKLDRKYVQKAREDLDFHDLRSREDFRDLTR